MVCLKRKINNLLLSPIIVLHIIFINWFMLCSINQTFSVVVSLNCMNRLKFNNILTDNFVHLLMVIDFANIVSLILFMPNHS